MDFTELAQDLQQVVLESEQFLLVLLARLHRHLRGGHRGVGILYALIVLGLRSYCWGGVSSLHDTRIILDQERLHARVISLIRSLLLLSSFFSLFQDLLLTRRQIALYRSSLAINVEMGVLELVSIFAVTHELLILRQGHNVWA